MSRSVKRLPFTTKKVREQYMRYERRKSAKKKGNPNMKVSELMKLWDDPLSLEEIAAREWEQFLVKEMYGYY